MTSLLANLSASISELKRNPSALIQEAEGNPIIILNHNKPTAYLIPAEPYEAMHDLIEELSFGEIVKQRQNEKSKAVEVSIDEL